MWKRSLPAALLLLAAGAGLWWMAGGGRSLKTLPSAPAGASGADAEPAALLAEPAAPDDRAPRGAEEVGAARNPAADPAQAATSPAQASVVVRIVRSDTGEPLPRERVLLLREGDKREAVLVEGSTGALGDAPQADGQGRCTFLIPAGVRARAIALRGLHRDGKCEAPVEPLAAGETRELTLALPVFRHWIRVEDADLGFALAGARVSSGGQDVTTDADGLASTWCAEWDVDQVSVEAQGYGPAMLGVVPGHETPGSALPVPLSRSACLKGRVLDAADRPIDQAGVEVVAQGSDLARTDAFIVKEGGFTLINFEEHRWSARTDASGAFTLCDLPPSISLQVTVFGAGEWLPIPEPLQLAPGEQREVVYRPGAGAVVRGSVRDESGGSVPSCELWLRAGVSLAPFGTEELRTGTSIAFSAGGRTPAERRVSSDAEGRFEFPNVIPGVWGLGPAPKSGYLPLAMTFEVPADRSDVELVLEVSTALFVGGHVVGPDGQPLSKIHVSSDVGPYGETAADGTFRIGPFAPGPVTLDVIASTGLVAPAGFKVQAGEEDVLLRLEAGGSIAGHIKDDATGEPVGGGVSLSTGSSTVWFATVDASGEFAFEGLRPGSYGLSARSPTGGAGCLEHLELAGQGARLENVVVRLVPGGQLALRFPPGPQRRTYRVRSGACVHVFDSVGPEESVTPQLPPGEVTVELLALRNELLLSRQVVVVAGTTVAVDLSEDP